MSLDIPLDFPLAKFHGQSLMEVCIGRHNVRLIFYKWIDASVDRPRWAPGATIHIEAGFALSQEGQTRSVTNDVLGKEAGCLTTLLGESITSHERLEKNELMLVFSNLATLQIRTDPVGFESYHLHIDGRSVDVTTSYADA